MPLARTDSQADQRWHDKHSYDVESFSQRQQKQYARYVGPGKLGSWPREDRRKGGRDEGREEKGRESYY